VSDQRQMMLVVNPSAGHGRTGRNWPRLKDYLHQHGLSFDWAMTERPLHATELTREALKAGYRCVVAVGGDGTLNEVVNGFFEGTTPIAPEARCGLISTGTGSDFRRTFGWSKDLRAAVQRFTSSDFLEVDVGVVSCVDRDGRQVQRLFINVVDLGVGGETVVRVESGSKALGGFLTFFWGVLATLATFRNKQVKLTLDGEEVFDGRVASVLVANGAYCAGGMHVAPGASPCDGRFDIIVVGDMPRLQLLAALPSMYWGGHLRLKKVSRYSAREVEVCTQEHMLLQADGELLGTAPARFRILPRALRVQTGRHPPFSRA